MKKTKMSNKNAGKCLGLISMLVIGIIFTYTALFGIVNQEPIVEKSWHVIWEGSLPTLGAEATPGANVSGILSVYFHPHQTDIGGYLENSSSNLETNCTGAGFGFANADDTEVDLIHSTAFDVVIRVRGNNTNCRVGSVFFDTNLRVRWTCADLSVSADTELTLDAGEAKTTANDTLYTHLYMNFFDDNSGSGFTISQDQTIEITSIKFEAYF